MISVFNYFRPMQDPKQLSRYVFHFRIVCRKIKLTRTVSPCSRLSVVVEVQLRFLLEPYADSCEVFSVQNIIFTSLGNIRHLANNSVLLFR